MTEFGHSIRHFWSLDPGVAFLNHGSFGATPRVVRAAQDRWREIMERQPVDFLSRKVHGHVRAAAKVLAAELRAEPEDVVFVENATDGANAVIQSIGLRPGDKVVIHSQTYGAVRNTVLHHAALTGAEVVTVELPFPWRGEDVVSLFAAAVDDRTRLVVVDHITSPTAFHFPVAEIIRAVAPAPVLVDGAHAPGQLPLDLPALGAAWYTGNCHKWLCAPKGAAFLWAPKERQEELHPTVISHGWTKGYTAEFDWVGTRDPSAWLSVPDAISFRAGFGEQALRGYRRALAAEAAAMLAERWGTETAATPDRFGAMALIRLPVEGAFTQTQAVALRDRLLAEHRVELPINALPGGLWVRISAAPYNAMPDYERLAAAASALFA